MDDTRVRANAEWKRGLLLSDTCDDASQNHVGRCSFEGTCCSNRRLQRGLLPVTFEPRRNREQSLDRASSRELGQNYIWEAVSASPGFKGVPKTWDTHNTNDLTNSVRMVQLRYNSCLFYRFEPSQEQVEQKAGRHINDFMVIGPKPNVERLLAQAQGKMNLQDIVRLYKTDNEGRLSAMNLRKLEKGYELQNKPFLIYEIAADADLKMENAKTSLTPESISQTSQDDDDQLPTPSDTRIFRTHVDKAMYHIYHRPDIQHSVDTLSRSMRNPTIAAMQKLKKLTHHLLGTSNKYQEKQYRCSRRYRRLGSSTTTSERMAVQNSPAALDSVTTFEIHRARLRYVSDENLTE